MKPHYILFLLFYAFASHPLHAQRQGNIWYFGEGKGLDFNSGNPVPINGGQVRGYPILMGDNTRAEGSSAISDSNGDLLFYSNGQTIWNRENQAMPNGQGLSGFYSSTHAALIVPAPLSDTLFYVFTTSGLERNLQGGLRYSVVNMCLDEGRGDVIDGQKDIRLLPFVSEKLAAIQHPNGRDYWLIAHEYDTDAFYAYLIVSGRINPPVITNIGSVHEGNGVFPAIGQMKASSDGRRIALVVGNRSPALREVFDFDPLTGELSNFISLSTETLSYGIEFSPDNSKVYASSLRGIFQYDLNAGGGTQAAIEASKTLVSPANTVNCSGRGMQLGPDGIIYINGCLDNISAIRQPNILGINCDYTRNAVNERTDYTFPSFVAGYRYTNDLSNCLAREDDPITCTDGMDNDGDGFIDCDDMDCIYQTEESNIICEGEEYFGYTTTGQYIDTLTAQTGCDSIRILDLTVLGEIITNDSILICEGDDYEDYTMSGTYRDVFPSQAGCDSIRILELTVIESPITTTVQSICEGESFEGYEETGVYSDTYIAESGCDSIRILTLNVVPPIRFDELITICDGSYQGYSSTGVYRDTFSLQNGCDSIRTLDLMVVDEILFSESVQICAGEAYEGYRVEGIYRDTFELDNGCDSIRILELSVIDEVTNTIIAEVCRGENFEGYQETGVYLDTFPSAQGCDSIRVLSLSEIASREYLIIDTICQGELYEQYDRSGLYVDTFAMANTCDSIRILELAVNTLYIPNAFSPNFDGYNDRFQIFSPNPFLNIRSFYIFDRWGNQLFARQNFSINDQGQFWDGTTNGEVLDVGVYTYWIEVACQGKLLPFKGTVTLLK